MNNYRVEKFFTDEELDYLRTLYNTIKVPTENIGRYFNLFNVKRKTIPDRTTYPQWVSLKKRVEEEVGIPTRANYFLLYVPGSFASIHVDNANTVDLTSITLLDKSTDLEGGQTIILRKYGKTEVDGNIIEPKSDNNKIKSMIVPEVLKHDIGNTIFYDKGLEHGVTHVNKGTRLVLVSWFRKKQ